MTLDCLIFLKYKYISVSWGTTQSSVPMNKVITVNFNITHCKSVMYKHHLLTIYLSCLTEKNLKINTVVATTEKPTSHTRNIWWIRVPKFASLLFPNHLSHLNVLVPLTHRICYFFCIFYFCKRWNNFCAKICMPQKYLWIHVKNWLSDILLGTKIATQSIPDTT